jgi:hypothetical protein
MEWDEGVLLGAGMTEGKIRILRIITGEGCIAKELLRPPVAVGSIRGQAECPMGETAAKV